MPNWLIDVIKILGALASGSLLTTILKRKWDKDDRRDEILEELSKTNAKIDDFKLSFMQELEKDRRENAEYRAKQSRARILSFNDELIRKIRHTKESFDDVIAEVDRYEDYCSKNPDFPNFKAVAAIENIKSTYKKCQQEGSFLS